MPVTPVIETASKRVYGKGIHLAISTTLFPMINFATGEPADRTALGTWLDNFTFVGGVVGIDGPNMDHDDIELDELDNTPGAAGLVGTENLEMFFANAKFLGDKSLDALNITLNMNPKQYQVLYMTYLKNTIYGWSINFPSGAFLIGVGFTESLECSFEPNKVIEVAYELQPSFGMQFVSTCDSRASLHGQWLTYIEGLACPT